MSRFLVATTGHAVPLLGGETCVGADPAVEIPVRGEMGLMPRHFVIVPRERGWQLEAFDGAAVLVNGQQVSQTAIHDGDLIVAGQLTLTYRDEQEAAMASMSKNSFPSLHLGLSQAGPVPAARGRVVPPPLQQSESGDTEVSREDDIFDAEADMPKRAKGGSWDHFLLTLLGVLLLAFGGWEMKMCLFGAKPVSVMECDVVRFEAQIMGGVKVPRKVNGLSFRNEIQGIDVVGVHLQPEGAKEAVHCIVELPADLPYDSSWQEPGNVAVIGVLENVYNPEALMNGRWNFVMAVTTLEVNGKAVRTLTQHNAALASSQSQFLTFAGYGLMLLGAFFLLAGCERWNALRKSRAGRRGGAVPRPL